ncbi:hypothetical protein [Enterobacter sp. NFIX58]|uniref:hypothetical protein n=1 Tax=Enterobacter sp. NFIX58 TaxID=1566251 RepID=UPI0008BD9705|nr:hypothetical protein [Enterobacter sp. NFIX58]SEP40115.1 hypothetical protein SAMN03159286_0140 [Enterobacter sp. NFIX58]
MSDTEHIVSIILHIIQAIAAVIFLIVMWKWSRKPKAVKPNKMQEAAAIEEMERQYRLTKKSLEAIKNMSSLGR